MATANGEAEAERFYKAAEREKQQLEKRIKELDNIIRCLYEDRVCGRITPELLRVFIRKIEVFEEMEKYSRKVGNLINIHYAFQFPEQNGMQMLKMLLPSNIKETA